MKGVRLILFGILIFLFSISPVLSVSPYDWESYGNTWTPNWNMQYDDARGELDEGVLSISISSGMTTGKQPLVTALNTSEGEVFLVFANGDNIQVYDEGLDLVSEKSTFGTPQQLLIMDWDSDGLYNDIAGAYIINSSLFSFKVYTFHTTSENLTHIYEQNFTTSTTPQVTGARRKGEKAVFVYTYLDTGSDWSANLTFINSSTTTQIQLPYTSSSAGSNSFTEEPAWWDMDRDGTLDYMTYSDRRVVIVDENGVEKYTSNYTGNIAGGTLLEGAKIIQTDCELTWLEWLLGYPCNIDWRILEVSRVGLTYGTESVTVKMSKLDGTTLWTDTLVYTGSTEGSRYGVVAIADDYQGDEKDVVYAIGINDRSVNPDYAEFRVYEATDGTILAGYNYTGDTSTFDNNNFLTVGHLDNNDYFDFVFVSSSALWVFDPALETFYIEEQSVPSNYCIPADLNNDGIVDIICSASGDTDMYYADYTNQNAEIVSVAYDPSTTIQVNSTLNIYITATDTESDTIYYSHRCNSSANWSTEDTTLSKSCYYDTIGIYQSGVRVRDAYHYGVYDTFYQNIIVTTTGIVCDNDGTCESGQGETNANCPNDCPLAENQTQSELEGSIPLPTKIVDPDNVEQGLLPEIYYGTLGFLSGVLSPLIILVFVVFFALIIIAIGKLVKKVAHEVG